MHPFVNANICSKTSIGEIFLIVNRILSNCVQLNGQHYNQIESVGAHVAKLSTPTPGVIGYF